MSAKQKPEIDFLEGPAPAELVITDLEVGDVARVLGISRFSVRRRIRRALALLEEEMGWFG